MVNIRASKNSIDYFKEYRRTFNVVKPILEVVELC